MYQVVTVSVVLWLVSGDLAHSQRLQQPTSYPSRYRPHQVPPSLVAQDRRYTYLNHLKKFQRQKFKQFKKYFRKCGISPFKFQIFRRSDDDDVDTIHVVVPYGFTDEYLPKPEMQSNDSGPEIKIEDDFNRVRPVPAQYHLERRPTKTRNLYSVRYRSDPGNNGHDGNGTVLGTTGNVRR